MALVADERRERVQGAASEKPLLFHRGCKVSEPAVRSGLSPGIPPRGGQVSQLVEFPLAGGGSVRVEVGEEGIARAGRAGEVVATAQQTLQKALDPIRPIAESVLEKLHDLAETPDRISVEFGLKLSVETGVIVARGTAEANFTVQLEWNRPAGSGR
jgi:hypothetical protein